MTLWPRSLFGRLALLLVMVIAVSQATAILLYRQDRAALVARQFSDTKVLQLQALRVALAATDLRERSQTLTRLGEEYGARIVSDDAPRLLRRHAAKSAAGRAGRAASHRAGPGDRVAPATAPAAAVDQAAGRRPGLLGGIPLAPPVRRRPVARARMEPDRAGRAARQRLCIRALPGPAVAAAERRRRQRRRRARRSRRCRKRGRRKSSTSIAASTRCWPTCGRPSRTARCCWPACRTICARRWRACASVVEVGTHDEQMREGMAADIEEMDKIIGQFLDFGRDDRDVALEMRPLDEVVAPLARALPPRRQRGSLQRRRASCAADAGHRDVATACPI